MPAKTKIFPVQPNGFVELDAYLETVDFSWEGRDWYDMGAGFLAWVDGGAAGIPQRNHESGRPDWHCEGKFSGAAPWLRFISAVKIRKGHKGKHGRGYYFRLFSPA